MTDPDLADDEWGITPLGESPKWVIEINETKVNFYSGSKPERWAFLRQRPGVVPRLTTAKEGIFGDLVHIAFEKREEAEGFRDFLADTCVHKSAMKVRRAPKRRADQGTP